MREMKTLSIGVIAFTGALFATTAFIFAVGYGVEGKHLGLVALLLLIPPSLSLLILPRVMPLMDRTFLGMGTLALFVGTATVAFMSAPVLFHVPRGQFGVDAIGVIAIYTIGIFVAICGTVAILMGKKSGFSR
jgi:hypothetical protein